jgi:DNA repair protein RecO (recombination protein O)
MNQILTTGIVLGRTDYGEADRILTVLTPDQGKLRLMAKGVRRVKSKLAGGIELFSVSQITFIRGRGDIGTLVSTRLNEHYGNIVSHIDRVQLGYELIKLLDKATEDEPESGYFDLLVQAFEALNDSAIDTELVRTWFSAQLLRQGGLTPNLANDNQGHKLSTEQRYDFGMDEGLFVPRSDGNFGVNEIKFLRLIFGHNSPAALAKISDGAELAKRTRQLVTLWQQQYIQ